MNPVVDACAALLKESVEQDLQSGLAEMLSSSPEFETEDPEIQRQLRELLDDEQQRLTRFSE